MKLTNIAVTTLALAAGMGLATSAGAATAVAAKPATAMAAKPAAAVVASTLFCQIGKSDTKVTVQVVNTGTKDVAAGTLFTYTVLGPKTKTPGSYKLLWALGPKEWVNLTKPVDAASIKSCTPAVK